MLNSLFTDPDLKAHFSVQPADELITYRSVNGNKARSKFCPNTNVQAMMAYELMRAGLSCAFWIESRDIRRFDSHQNRASLWERDRRTPRGQPSSMPSTAGTSDRQAPARPVVPARTGPTGLPPAP